MEHNTDDIVKKVKKLLALAQSPNEAEAAAAALKVQELLEKHNLSMAAVENLQSEIVCEDIENGKRQAKWRLALLSGVARAYFTQLLIVSRPGSYTWQLVGKAHNVLVTRSMFEYLCCVIERISRESDVKKRIRRSAESFRLGMAHSIVQRLDTHRKGGFFAPLFSRSLVSTLYKNEHALVERYIKNMGNVRFRSSPTKVSNRCDYLSGIAAGKKVSLNDQIERRQRRAPLKIENKG